MSERVDRLLRVNELMKRELGLLIQRDSIAPDGMLLSVTAVKTSSDLRNATVLLSIFGGSRVPNRVRDTVDRELAERRKDWQRHLAKTLGFKHTPVLCFRYDSRLGDGDRVIGILNGLEASGEYAPDGENDAGSVQ